MALSVFCEFTACSLGRALALCSGQHRLHSPPLIRKHRHTLAFSCLPAPQRSAPRTTWKRVELGGDVRYCCFWVSVLRARNCWLENVTVFYLLCVTRVCCRSTEVYWSHFNKLNCLLIWHLPSSYSVLSIYFFVLVVFFEKIAETIHSVTLLHCRSFLKLNHSNPSL